MPKIINPETVFDAALKVFVAEGYRGATTVEIAKVAGINEATLFRKYGTKLELIEQAVHHGLSRSPFSEVAYSGDLRHDLLAIVTAYMQVNADYGALVSILLTEIPRHPELRGAMTPFVDNISRAAAVIARYQSDGTLKKEVPLGILGNLLAPLMTRQMIARAVIDLTLPDLSLADHVETFLTGWAVNIRND